MAVCQEDLIGVPINALTFSPDNRLVVASSGCHLIAYVLDSPSTFNSVRCTDEIVSAVFISPDELRTVTSSGELASWSLSPNFELVPMSSKRITAFFVHQVCWSADGKYSVWRIEESDRGDTHSLYYLSADDSLKPIASIPADLSDDQLALGGQFCVYCYSTRLTVISLDNSCVIKQPTFNMVDLWEGAAESKKYELIRVCAYGDTIAVSAAFGKIFIWGNVSSKGLDPSSLHALHWHKMSAPMALTPFGGLLSAGAEAVLCKWVLNGAGEPSLLPRLAAPVSKLFVSPDSSLVALLMEDNSSHIVSISSMSVECSLPFITWCERSPNNIFTTDPRNKMVAVNGKPGCIQWLNPFKNSTQAMANISLENVVDGDMSLVGIIQTYHELDYIFFCTDHVASLERLINFNQDHKRLRIWQRNRENCYMLSLQESLTVSRDTRFVAGCKYPVSDSDKVFLTCTSSGEISMWCSSPTGSNWRKDNARCTSWQKTGIRCVSSVQSGLVWASGHIGESTDKVVIWDLAEMKVKDVISTDGVLQSIKWCSPSLCLYSTDISVSCWDISTSTLVWSVEQCLNLHVGKNGCFAWSKNEVIEFEGSTGRLVNSFTFSKPIRDLVVVAVGKGKMLVAKTRKGISLITPTVMDGPKTEKSIQPTPFSQMETLDEHEVVNSTRMRSSQYQNALNILDGPCHALPHLTQIAPMFISKCLAPPAS